MHAEIGRTHNQSKLKTICPEFCVIVWPSLEKRRSEIGQVNLTLWPYRITQFENDLSVMRI